MGIYFTRSPKIKRAPWYVSNVSIIFDWSMLYYILFWTLSGFIIHFYIIFGTNLLTGGPAQIAVFCLFQSFTEKEYQTESKRMKPSGTWFSEQTWSRGLGVDVKQSMRRARERGARLPSRRALHPHGAHVAPPTYFFLLYIPTYPKPSEASTKT